MRQRDHKVQWDPTNSSRATPSLPAQRAFINADSFFLAGALIGAQGYSRMDWCSRSENRCRCAGRSCEEQQSCCSYGVLLRLPYPSSGSAVNYRQLVQPRIRQSKSVLPNFLTDLPPPLSRSICPSRQPGGMSPASRALPSGHGVVATNGDSLIHPPSPWRE